MNKLTELEQKSENLTYGSQKTEREIKDFFNKNKIKYKIMEIWSDSFEN